MESPMIILIRILKLNLMLILKKEQVHLSITKQIEFEKQLKEVLYPDPNIGETPFWVNKEKNKHNTISDRMAQILKMMIIKVVDYTYKIWKWFKFITFKPFSLTTLRISLKKIYLYLKLLTMNNK